MTSSSGFRSLADQLRAWPDERIAALLHARPDLATPAPHDSGQLASRAATRASQQRALDQLTRSELVVLDAVVVLQHTTPEALEEVVNARPETVRAALDHLLGLAVVWESDAGLRALTGVTDALGTISGLRPATEGRSPADVRPLVEQVSPAARAMLEHVVDAGGEAVTSARTTVSVADAATPAEELIARGLLVARAGGPMVVPGEAGIAVRGHTTVEPVDVAPEVPTSPRARALVDKIAAGAAFEAVRRTELLVDGWGAAPPAALRSGGLGVRDLRATAARLHVDEPTAGLLVEVAHEAGLVTAAADPEGSPAWLPTDRFDTWCAEPVAERWATLAAAWLASDRTPSVVGERDQAGKVWNALQPELVSPLVQETRRMTLAQLALLPDGEVLAAGTGVPGLVARLGWLRPRRPRQRTDLVVHILTEAATLGVTGLEGLASYARALVDGGDPASALAELMPDPVDHVLLQADLTAVAPGPLEPALARSLQLIADVESRGGATVYRFTPASVRRALEAGWSAAEVHGFLASVSRTPVPQPLGYLVDDAARTFGSIRVGYAEAFLRADDETALTELLHHPRAATLGLRRIAPTVLISSTPIDVLLPRLRELGAAPVVEAADGSVHVARPDQLRARTPRSHRSPAAEARESARVAAVVRALRAGDEAAASGRSTAQLTPADALAALREAVETSVAVVITYVDNHGTLADRVVSPVRVEGGQLVAVDSRVDETRAFAVHRIRDVRPVER
ncbi:helicase-associated domain-containing protein [Nocardioides panacihumi]|uniref:Helicase-associated domain-containing protein n=1 Tax=Nocardioides panacihumi TaxID=400774 RepID=A0ABN2Q5Y8_9ACTN